MDDLFEDLGFITEALHKPQEKNAVVIVGRFNPPTVGHYKIINQAKKFIRENKHLNLLAKPIVVIIDGKKSGKDKKRNPLTAHERIYFMEHSGKANGVKFLKATNAFEAFNTVRKHGYEPLVIGAGSDRIDGYLKMLNSKFLNNHDRHQKHYRLDGLERHELPANEASLKHIKSDDRVKSSEVSASLARRAVELDYFDEFIKIVGLEKNIPAAKKMFKHIKNSLSGQE